MFRLKEPDHSHGAVLDECLQGITGNSGLRAKLQASRANLLVAGEQYIDAGAIGELCNLAPTPEGVKNPCVVVDMTTSDFVKIYNQYFVANDKPARKIYDDLMVSAQEKCPFCGGIGRPRNLDHFLPKSRFPQFSVLPVNLIPACRDCNFDGKSEGFATCPEDQVIHPYTDSGKFFTQQWIFAKFSGSISDPEKELEYFVRVPDGWNDVDRKRAEKHFETFDLSVRYAIKAAEQRGTVINQVRHMQNGGVSADAIREMLLQPGVDESPFPNHWQVGMYQAFMHSL